MPKSKSVPTKSGHDFAKSNIVPIECENFWQKNLLISAGVFLVLAIVFFVSAQAYGAFYKDRIFPGVYVGQHSLGGMTEMEAKDFIEKC